MPQLAHKHTCNQHHLGHLSANAVQQFDPTHTLTLRNAFARDMNRRFIELRGIIRKAIIEEDVFGLRDPPTVLQLSTPGKEAFAFSRSGQKVNQFMAWLKEQEQLGILEVSDFGFGIQFGQGIEPAWTDKYIQSAYQSGIKQARQEMRKAGISVPTIEASGGIEAAFNNPFHVDRVGLLFSRTFNDLKGITGAMDGQISRMLAKGLAEGQNPNTIARWLTKTISGPVGETLAITDTLGRFIPAQRRAKMLARTEVIRAHAEGTLQEFKNFGVAGVKVRAEFVTAGDDRVCFVEFTQIETINGQRAIADIKIGDKVLTRNGYKVVCNVEKKEYSGKMIFLDYGSNHIDCTADHPIWCKRSAFIRADELCIDDILQYKTNDFIKIRHISDWQANMITVYNLTVADQPEFYANGILVHNCAECEALEAQVFTIEEARGIIPVHPSCFPATTMIATVNGEVAIEDIKTGDMVLTRDGYKIVVGTNKRKHKGRIILISTEHNSVKCTLDHPIWIKRNKSSGAFRQAKSIRVGDCVQLKNSEYKKVTHVFIYEPCEIYVYNLTVADQPEFYANGILVHNCRCAWLPVTVN